LRLGAQVTGASVNIPTSPSMFVALDLQKAIRHQVVDVRDLAALRTIFNSVQPEFVFHLAAQAIVSKSYEDPVGTVSTNAIGTLNVLECLRQYERRCCAVLVTSDKCYDNLEWVWGYRENDRLGGKDVYSGSKAAAELLIRCYVHAFMISASHPVRVATGRAGNVIGGGDWAADRIVADCMRAWSQGQPVAIRSPRATRPWQHVLEPLSGYLALGRDLASSSQAHGEAFNFGPKSEQSHTVLELLGALSRRWGLTEGDVYRVIDDVPFRESSLLKLNCDKALLQLGWQPAWEYEETVRQVAEWYTQYYRGECSPEQMHALTMGQIQTYEQAARTKRIPWAIG
jgi:CDP-glucose 4,6-dehydratase